MPRLRRPSVVARALAQHAAISLAALVAVGALAAIICVQVVQDQALRRAEQYGASIARTVIAPRVTPGVEQGDTDWFTKPLIDSYHTVWFELHEDLLATLAIERAREGEG